MVSQRMFHLSWVWEVSEQLPLARTGSETLHAEGKADEKSWHPGGHSEGVKLIVEEGTDQAEVYRQN